MRSLKAPWKDFRRRRALARAGLRPELACTTWSAGARSGTWTLHPDRLGPDSVVWSVGVGDNVAWDLAVIERFGVDVHAFDPTPRAVAFVAGAGLPDRFRFAPVGLAAHDGTQGFAAPSRERSVNYRPGAGHDLELPVRRLATLARERGQARIDVLKLDVEGGEYALLDDVLASGVEVEQLLVEFHHDQAPFTLDDTLRAVEALRSAGFRLFHVSPRGLELSFLRR